ncbi:MAG: HNH endonuclease [Dehalococcoidia bacterium]
MPRRLFEPASGRYRRIAPSALRKAQRQAARKEAKHAREIARFKANPRAVNALGQRYAPHWLRMEVLERDSYRCCFCGVAVTNHTANIHHLTPWPWGMTELKNLRTACHDCNRAKGSKSRTR